MSLYYKCKKCGKNLKNIPKTTKKCICGSEWGCVGVEKEETGRKEMINRKDNNKNLQDKILKTFKDYEEGKFTWGVKLKKGRIIFYTIDEKGVKEIDPLEKYKIKIDKTKMQQIIDGYRKLGILEEEEE